MSVLARLRPRPRARIASLRRRWSEYRFRRRLVTPRLLAAFADAYPDAFFVEIGANDGHKYDHLEAAIRDRGWRGIMVEPVPFVFERLQRNLGGLERIALENVAIADRDGELPFYHLAEADPAELGRLPGYYDALGSFSRDVVVSHVDVIPDIERRVVETRVPCLTYDSLCRRHGDPTVDLLLIDVEGYDWELLKTIDLERHRPRLVVFEHYHLSPDDRRACLEWLAEAGYEAVEEILDHWCLDTRIDDELTALWRRTEGAITGISAHESPLRG